MQAPDESSQGGLGGGKRPASEARGRGLARVLPAAIGGRLVSLIGLTLLPLLLLLGSVHHARYQVQRANAVATELEVAQGVAATFSVFLVDVRSSSHLVGRAILTFDRYTQAKATRVLSEVPGQYRSVRNMSWLLPDGTVVASSEPGLVGRNLSQRGYFRAVAAGAAWSVGDLTPQGTLTPGPFFGIATAVRGADGGLQGVVVAGVEPLRLAEGSFTQRRPAGSTFTLFDSQGLLVFSSPAEPFTWEERLGWRDRDPVLQRALTSGEPHTGSLRREGDGGAWVTARVPVAGLGWVAGAATFEEVAFAPIEQAMWRDTLTALAVTLLALLSAYGVARTIAHPLRRLEQETTVRLARGELAPKPDPQAPSEVQRLRAAVEGMAREMVAREQAARHAHQLLSGIIDGTPDLVAALDTRFCYLAFNRAYGEEFRRVFGPAIAVGDSMSDLLAHLPEDRARAEELWGRALHGESYTITEAFGDPARDRQIYDLGFSPVRDGEGKVIGAAHIVRNVTERVLAEEALRESEDRYRAIFEQAAVGIGRVSFKDARWIDANDALCTLVGYSLEEMRATPWPRITHPEDLDRDLLPFHRMAAGELRSYSVEKRFIHKQGQVIWARLTLSLVRDAQGIPDYEIAVVEDIGERKRGEEGRLILEAMMEHIPLGITIATAPDVNIRAVSRFGRELLERPAEELVGIPAERHPQSWHVLHADGVTPATADELPLTRATRGGEVVREEVWVVVRSDGTKIPILCTAAPIRNEGGEIVAGVIGWQDITERSRAEQEREKLITELARSNRELEQFAYVSSHDLQEPLRMVASYVQLLARKYQGRLDPQADKYIGYAVEGAVRMQKLIEGLLAYSRISTRGAAFGPVDLNQVFAGAVANLALPIQEQKAQVIAQPLPTVEGDEVQLLQLLQNLIANALKFSRAGVPPRIQLAAQRLEQQWCVSVADNGIGIRPEHYERIFQIFQRLHTREEYPGTGIGLALCRRIVERHRGQIWVESQPAAGSTFYFTLPIASGDSP